MRSTLRTHCTSSDDFPLRHIASDAKLETGSRGVTLHYVTEAYGTNSTSRCLDHNGAPHRIIISVRKRGVGIFFGHLYAACILDDSRL